MSTSLPVRAKALRERLVELDRLGANVEETGLLDDLRLDLEPPAAKLSRSLDQRALLMNSGDRYRRATRAWDGPQARDGAPQAIFRGAKGRHAHEGQRLGQPAQGSEGGVRRRFRVG